MGEWQRPIIKFAPSTNALFILKAHTETNVKDTEAYKMGYADGDWANYYAKHKGSAPSIYDEAEAQVKQKTAAQIFEELDDTQRTQTTEVVGDLIIIEKDIYQALKHKYLKVRI